MVNSTLANAAAHMCGREAFYPVQPLHGYFLNSPLAFQLMYDPYTHALSQESLLTRQRGMRRQQKQVMAAGDMEEKLSNFLQIFEHSGAFKVGALWRKRARKSIHQSLQSAFEAKPNC